VEWATGPCVAPYACAVARHRPVIAAVVDRRRARLHRWQGGAVEPLETLEAEERGRPPSHMGDAPRAGFHTGTRGATGADEADRRREAALQALAAATARRLRAHAGRTAWIVLGGTAEAVAAVQRALPAPLARRALVVPALHDGASDAVVRRAAAEGATLLRTMHDLVEVDELLERYGAAGPAVAGLEPSRRALAEGAVQRLVLSDGFVAAHPAEAERAVRAALDQRADVASVGGSAGERLDRDGGGIGARLRFTRG
jgi:stalled ribosome rescue protein Dom34